MWLLKCDPRPPGGRYYSLKGFTALLIKSFKVLIPFSTNYLCEKVLSVVVYIQNKFRNLIENIEVEL